MNIHYNLYDLPDSCLNPDNKIVGIDTEAMGLKYTRDRLCLVQLTFNAKDVYLVHFPEKKFSQAKNLISVLTNNEIQKIFHFARFDVGILQHYFNIVINNIYCTKIASFLSRTYANKHGLKDLCKEFLNIDLNKNETSSDWGASSLTDEQKRYAAYDVLYLFELKAKLDEMLMRENRAEIAKQCFNFLSTRAILDVQFENFDIFSHSLNAK